MYLCSDLKSHSKDQGIKLIYNQVDLLNNKNLKSNINEIKESLNQKKRFLSSYEQITSVSALKNKKSQTRIEDSDDESSNNFMLNSPSQSSNNILSQDFGKTSESLKQAKKEEADRVIDLDIEKQLQFLRQKVPLISLNYPTIKTTKSSQFRESKRTPSFKSSNLTETKLGNSKRHVKSFSMNFNSDTKIDRSILNEYKKIFDKNLSPILDVRGNKKYFKKGHNNEERQKWAESSRINAQIVEMKDKIHFMKGIIDYTFPKVMVGKIKIFKESSLNKNVSRSEGSKPNLFPLLQPLHYNKEETNFGKSRINSPRGEIKNQSNFQNFNKNRVKVFSPMHIRSLSNYE